MTAMNIEIQHQGQDLLVTLQGRLDTITTPEVSEALKDVPEGVSECILEVKNLEYISSAGLRLLLLLHKRMLGSGGRLLLRNVQPGVRDILEMTGFTSFLFME